MRFLIGLVSSLILAILLSGCWMDGSGAQYNNFDGTWQVAYVPADSQCTVPLTTITIQNGSGSALQGNSVCTGKTPTTGFTGTANFQLSVSIAGNSATVGGSNNTATAFNAIAAGQSLAGTCISPRGCSASSATGGSISMTR